MHKLESCNNSYDTQCLTIPGNHPLHILELSTHTTHTDPLTIYKNHQHTTNNALPSSRKPEHYTTNNSTRAQHQINKDEKQYITKSNCALPMSPQDFKN